MCFLWALFATLPDLPAAQIRGRLTARQDCIDAGGDA